jgi:hypothetical protein
MAQDAAPSVHVSAHERSGVVCPVAQCRHKNSNDFAMRLVPSRPWE